MASARNRKENAFKEVAPILCLALSAISLVAALHDTSDIHCSAADINHSPTENKGLPHHSANTVFTTRHQHFKAQMDRRPDAREHGRLKRQRTSVTESKIDPHIPGMSDESDDGGVKLDGYYGKPAVVKQESGDREVKRQRSESPPHESEQSAQKRRKSDFEDHDTTPAKTETRFEADATSKKRQKKEGVLEEKPNPYLAHQYAESEKKSVDPKSNPYLAHMYDDDESYNGYSNGYGKTMDRTSKVSEASTLGRLPRHRTTAAMARKAEDGPANAFTGRPLSSQYFNILKTRRNLPVHSQR